MNVSEGRIQILVGAFIGVLMFCVLFVHLSTDFVVLGIRLESLDLVAMSAVNVLLSAAMLNRMRRMARPAVLLDLALIVLFAVSIISQTHDRILIGMNIAAIINALMAGLLILTDSWWSRGTQ